MAPAFARAAAWPAADSARHARFCCNPVAGFLPVQRKVRWGTPSASRQSRDRARLARGFAPQAVIDGDGEQPRAASCAPGASAPPAPAARWNRDRRRRRGRERAHRASGSNSVFASAAETGAASSAADTLLFSLDTLLHAGRCTGKFAQDLTERRAGGFLLAERGERLSEPQQRVRRLGRSPHIWSRR